DPSPCVPVFVSSCVYAASASMSPSSLHVALPICYDADLVATARAVAQEFGDEIRPLPNLLLPTDALVAAAAGYPAVTLLAAGENGAIPNYHSHSDVLANADRRVVELAETYAWRLLVAIGRRAGA